VIRLFLFLFLILVPVSAFSAIVYVDVPPAESGSGWNETNGTSYTGTPGTGTGYGTIQAAFTAMSLGDKCYIRGGTYTENFGNTYTAIQLPKLDGTAWTEGNYSYVGSYPGEWAILDGSGNSKYVTFGCADSGHGAASNDRIYWKIERLEITGGNKGGPGFWRGPIWMRYCYIHDNYDGTANENPSGLRAYHLQNCIIEYNLFEDNADDCDGGSYENCAQIQIFNDYNDCFDDVDVDSRTTLKNNTIRYNYIVNDDYNARVGIKHKGNGQCLTEESAPDLTNKDLGSKWHHNIIIGMTHPIYTRVDYMQVYNNICDGGSMLIGCGTPGQSTKQKFYNVSYNNTVTDSDVASSQYRNAPILYSIAYGPSTFCSITYPLTTYYPRATCLNNIVSNSSASGSGAPGQIALGVDMDETGPNTLTMTDTTITNNLIYKSVAGNDFCIGENLATNCDQDENGCSQSTFDTLYGFQNYSSTANNLFAGSTGANKYILYNSGSFTDGLDGESAATAGYDSSHPYLSGINIPEYIGAVNPSDSSWVAGVMALDVTYFTSAEQGSTPSWIEGAEEATVLSTTGCLLNGIKLQ